MPKVAETIVFTVLALVAFASNSILNRLALAGGHIDAASFTTVRLAAGAVVLGALVWLQDRSLTALRAAPQAASGIRRFAGPLALFAYAAPFSFAYVRIGAATGALILFASVQLTMIGWGLVSGERPGPRTWVGLGLAAGGLLWLTVPSLTRPDPIGTALMVIAGGAWGVYSLAGKRSTQPLAANARSFLLAAPLAGVLNLATAAASSATASGRGVLLAVVSGGITSGLGYAIWYRALRGLTATRAAILQLGVPIIAALGAVGLLHETLSPRLATATVAVLGGVALALSGRRTSGSPPR
jgi:drug/metabolite transporter (DMT)-like permease